MHIARMQMITKYCSTHIINKIAENCRCKRKTLNFSNKMMKVIIHAPINLHNHALYDVCNNKPKVRITYSLSMLISICASLCV